MTVNREYCMSSYLMYRTVINKDMAFTLDMKPLENPIFDHRVPIYNSEELEEHISKYMKNITASGKTALALSGGIDSAILAKYMPKGSIAYTFKCIVPNIEVTDESSVAALYAEECGLEHRIVEIYWKDIVNYTPVLMKRKGAPIHSIESQIYKAALQAKADGFDKLIFGESADSIYGGLSKLLSRNWRIGDFIDRYSFVKPHHVLKDPILITEPIKKHEINGYINVHSFLNDVFFNESTSSYFNACDAANIEFHSPYMMSYMASDLDLDRVRNGENKYIVRELFSKLYPNFTIPEKTPMPRPTNEWLSCWKGPIRPEFYFNCTEDMSGDQKWLVFCLEWFLELIEEGYFANKN